MAARLWPLTVLISLCYNLAVRTQSLYTRACSWQVAHLVAMLTGQVSTSTLYCSVVKPKAQLALLLRGAVRRAVSAVSRVEGGWGGRWVLMDIRGTARFVEWTLGWCVLCRGCCILSLLPWLVCLGGTEREGLGMVWCLAGGVCATQVWNTPSSKMDAQDWVGDQGWSHAAQMWQLLCADVSPWRNCSLRLATSLLVAALARRVPSGSR